MKFSQLMIMVVIVLLTSSLAAADSLAPLVDDFSDPTKNNLQIERFFFDDRSGGGATETEVVIEAGLLKTRGELIPGRGQPAWASVVLPLAPMNGSVDASQFEGVRLRLKVTQGNLTVSANDVAIRNYDYHSAPIPVHTDGEFHVVDVPFKTMKRGWSAQTKLDTGALASLSIVAFSLKQDTVDFEVDEVSFY